MLRLDQSSLGQTAAGQLVNLLSNDVDRFDMTPLYLHYIWLMTINLVMGTFVMYKIVGIAALAGIAALTIQAVPLQGKFLI